MRAMAENFIHERKGAVARITLNMPDIGNALSLSRATRLGRLISDYATDESVRAILLRGAGAHFCRGRDRSDDPKGKFETLREWRAALADPVLGLFTAVRDAPIPVVAAVTGLANGLGCALAGACDVTITADDAQFGIPAMDQNRPPTLAMSGAFDRVLPKHLQWMVYTCRKLDARAAQAIGLVSHVVPAAAFDAEVERTLTEITRAERGALIAVKKYVRESRLLDLRAAAELGGDIQGQFELALDD
jgi:enoyl-CoA hydratase